MSDGMEVCDMPAAGDAAAWDGRQISEMLQQVERQVAVMMKDAKRVQQERDSLLETLYILQNEDCVQSLSAKERETTNATCEGLVAKCLSVEVSIDPGREPDEELALHMVNNWIDQLILTARQNPAKARVTCELYVQTLNGDGTKDESFYSIVTSCSPADRETVGARLMGLLRYIDYVMSLPAELE